MSLNPGDQITLGGTHEITVGRHRDKAWPKAEVSRTIQPGESAEEALAATLVALDQALEASILQAVNRINNPPGS